VSEKIGNQIFSRSSSRLPPGVLCPAVEPSAQERHGPVGAGPEEGRKNDQERLRELGLFSLEKIRLRET